MFNFDKFLLIYKVKLIKYLTLKWDRKNLDQLSICEICFISLKEKFSELRLMNLTS